VKVRLWTLIVKVKVALSKSGNIIGQTAFLKLNSVNSRIAFLFLCACVPLGGQKSPPHGNVVKVGINGGHIGNLPWVID